MYTLDDKILAQIRSRGIGYSRWCKAYFCPVCQADTWFLNSHGVRLAGFKTSLNFQRVCLDCGFMAIQEPVKDKALRRQVFEADGGQCVYCGSYPTERCIDHIIPQSLGGGHEFENLVTSCRSCNTRKSNRSDLRPAFGRFAK